MVLKINTYKIDGRSVKIFEGQADGIPKAVTRHFISSLDLPKRLEKQKEYKTYQCTREFMDAIVDGGHVDISEKRSHRLTIHSLRDLARIYADIPIVRMLIETYFDGVITFTEEEEEEEKKSVHVAEPPRRSHHKKRASPPRKSFVSEEERQKKRHVANPAELRSMIADTFEKDVIPFIRDTIEASIKAEFGEIENIFSSLRDAYVATNSDQWEADWSENRQALAEAKGRAAALSNVEDMFNKIKKL